MDYFLCEKHSKKVVKLLIYVNEEVMKREGKGHNCQLCRDKTFSVHIIFIPEFLKSHLPR